MNEQYETFRKAASENLERFRYCWERFMVRLRHPRGGDNLLGCGNLEALARAAFEAGWEAAGGVPHKDRSECKHENVRGIAVVPRPCPSCGKPVY